jgi:pimeloyl-ACP methyl ester carboxylesterase
MAWTVAIVVGLAAACSGSASVRAQEERGSLHAATPGPAPRNPSGGTAGSPVVAVSWTPCRGDAGPSGDECARLRVPLDYGNPTGTTIDLALDRHRATGNKIGSLLINPGGPGASGVDSLDYAVSLLSPSVIQHFDVVGFDPRGVARSAPIHCLSGGQLDRFLDLDPAPTTEAGFQALVDASRAFDQGCERMSGDLLPYMSTEYAARDMDEIRQAVGDQKLTYLGFSYGTFLGATYADLFPERVRAMVLDGAVDPSNDPVTSNIDQSAAFQQELDSFFADCAARPSCPWKPGGDLHAAFDALMARIRAQPLPAEGKRTLGPGDAYFGVAQALYDRATWPDLAAALESAGRGDGSPLIRLFDEYAERSPDGTYGNEIGANNAISCLDEPWPRDLNVIRQAASTAKRRAPEFGAPDLFGGITCALWPVAATGRPHAIHASGSPPIVVIGSTGDPATPYAEAQALAGELERGVLITRVGDGHTGYRASACVRSSVDLYLTTLVVPRPGLTCPTP